MSSKQGKSSAVPKFGSFKPKPETAQIQPSHEDDDKSRQHGRGERTVSQKETSSHSLADETNPSSRNRTHEISYRSSPSDQVKDASFIYDRRGDPLVRRYGGVNRRDIPNYRRFGSGRILGVDGYMRIDHTKSYDEFFILGRSETRSLLSSDKKTLLAKGLHKSRPVRVRREQSQTDAGSDDFVPLRSSRKRRRAGSEPGGSSSEEEQSYRSIYGKSKDHEHSDSDVDYASDASTDPKDLGLDDPMNLKSVELSRKVRDHPEDIDAWFELVNHQDTLMRISSQDGRNPTTAEVKSFADIKLSMLEQAYSYATTDSQREALQLRIMREGSRVWDAKVLTKRWDEALEKYGGSFEVWKGYINHQQTKLSAFQYENIKKLYVEKLRHLESDASTKGNHSDRIQIYEHLIYAFLRLTCFISDAGYREFATAAWQATIELTFARPDSSLEEPNIRIPPPFQDFWESEVPRIGEESAQGWKDFVLTEAGKEPPEPKSLSKPILPKTRDGYKAWSIIEQQKARSTTNPARTLDDEAEDDPLRVVMFADIQDTLLYLPKDIISDIRNQLLDAFLIFNQLPPAYCSSTIIQHMILDDFLIRSSTNPIATEALQDPTTNIEEQEKRPPEFSHDYRQMATTAEVLFPMPHWFKNMKKIRDDIPTDQYQWILNTLKQLIERYGMRGLGPYYLAFESTNDPGHEKKIAKALLKQSSTVDLFRGYAILEWAKSNKDVARNTITAAMGSKSISLHEKISLTVAAAWMEIEDHNLTKGTLQLCVVSDEGSSTTSTLQNASASTAQILKARQFFSSNRDYLISSGNFGEALVYAEGLALLEYMTQESNKEPSNTNQGDIWSAVSSISTCSDELVTRDLGNNTHHERLLQFAARLLYHYASQGPFRPGFLREQLTKYINFFPQNTIFLSLFAWRETRLSIDDKVRSILDKVVLVEPYDCVSSRVFAIRYELHAGNVHSTRAAFEHALESEACKNHPGLWISYIRFCHDNKVLRSKAKSVFYRAIQRCPWSKEVFMEAFVTLVRDMDSSELRSVYNTLCEKGLRVHVEMEEFVEKWRREHKEKERTKK